MKISVKEASDIADAIKLVESITLPSIKANYDLSRFGKKAAEYGDDYKKARSKKSQELMKLQADLSQELQDEKDVTKQKELSEKITKSTEDFLAEMKELNEKEIEDDFKYSFKLSDFTSNIDVKDDKGNIKVAKGQCLVNIKFLQVLDKFITDDTITV